MSDPEEKTCSRCGRRQAADAFHRNAARSDGRAVWCKSCMNTYHREFNARPEVKRRAAERALARYHTFSDQEKARIQQQRYGQARHLLTKYQMTLEDYEARLRSQGGGCAICGKPPSPTRRHPVDHDHGCCPGTTSCGACVRGILCVTCNVWLGFYENADWRRGADEYLARSPKGIA